MASGIKPPSKQRSYFTNNHRPDCILKCSVGFIRLLGSKGPVLQDLGSFNSILFPHQIIYTLLYLQFQIILLFSKATVVYFNKSLGYLRSLSPIRTVGHNILQHKLVIATSNTGGPITPTSNTSGASY